MLSKNETENIFKKYVGKTVKIFTNDTDEKKKTFVGVLLYYKLWLYLTLLHHGGMQGHLVFLGYNEGITKVEDENGKVIFENEYLQKTKFVDTSFEEIEKRRIKANKMRLECFGPGNEL